MTMSSFEIDLNILKDHAPRFTFFEKPVENVNVDDIDEDQSFHPNGHMTSINLHDEYFFGVRADHFVFIDGWDEEKEDSILMVANHKGKLMIKLITPVLAEEG
ncbi:hypothetical protein ACW189_08525 [Limosilactobacillus fermentum]